jgi:hypothetical protein
MKAISTAIAVLVLGNPAIFAPSPQHRGHHGRGPGGPGMQARGMGGPGMSTGEHENIHALLDAHRSIARTIEEIPGGVKTRTVTSDPAAVGHLRAHVRQMGRRLELGMMVRPWDPVFRAVFEHADEISMTWEDIGGGIEVIETSENPEVVPLIRAHARKVDRFVAGGHEAARPPWAGRGRMGRP